MPKLIVVSGGTKGIGRAILMKFASHGFDAVTCARNEEDLKAFQVQFDTAFPGRRLFWQKADVSDRQQLESFAVFVRSLKRPVDVLVNNAGYFIPGQISNETEGTFESMLAANLSSAYHLTRALLPPMLEQKNGHIFNMCSTASIMAYTNGGSYCISKFALYGLTKVLRAELMPHCIRVTAILPGATLTASWEGVDLPPERFMKPEDVAESVYSAYAVSRHSVVEEILIRPQLGDL